MGGEFETMTAPDLLLFDLMGTLVREPFYREVPEFFGMSLRELLSVKSPTSWVEFESGRIDEAQFLDTFFADGREIDGEGLKACMREAYAYLPGARELLSDLKSAGVRMSLLSNYPVWYRMIDEKLGYSQFLESSFVSCDLGVRKPDPEAFEAVVQQLDVPSDSILFIDDRPENCAGAERLGLTALHYTDAHDLRAELTRRSILRTGEQAG